MKALTVCSAGTLRVRLKVSRMMVGATPITISMIFDKLIDAEGDEQNRQQRERDDLVEEENEAQKERSDIGEQPHVQAENRRGNQQRQAARRSAGR